MRKFSEGTKMWISVMAAFLIYAVVFILFDDYDRKMLEPLNQVNDWHLMVFAVVVMVILGFVLLRYCKRMDERIEQEQEMKQTLMRRQLTQNIAHEIKTPVASILGYTETLLSTPDIPSETAKRFLERTHVQAQRLTSLLADLSILNRVDYAPHVIAMHRVNVSQLVGDVVQDVELALKKKISDMYMKAGLEMIRTDEIMAMGTGDKRSQKGILTAILGDLEREGTITKVNPSYYISVQAWDNAVETAKSFDGEFTLAEYRDRLGTSRKYAAELLPAFDKAGITIFNGTSRTMVKR